MTPERWLKVEELFHASLERSPEERQAFLDERCGADAGLRRDVEVLLARGAQAGSFLDVSPLEDLAVAPLGAGSLRVKLSWQGERGCTQHLQQTTWVMEVHRPKPPPHHSR